MNDKVIQFFKDVPELYAQSDDAFWDDEHISKHMLAAHLNPDCENASRKQEEIKESVEWIVNLCESVEGKKLLDLGCGPGIYAEYLAEKGFEVTGIDFSRRSIDYAKESSKTKNLNITYHYQNYLEMEYEAEFDVVILIYCDFGVLSPADRRTLLQKVYRALKPGGMLILDVFGEAYVKTFEEFQNSFYESDGFWSPKEHVVFQRNHYFSESKNTLEQYLVLTHEDGKCYNIWNQLYTKNSFEKEVTEVGFQGIDFFDDVRGTAFSGAGNTISGVFRK